MNQARCALFLLLTSAWLGAAGHRAFAQPVPLGPEEEVYSDVFSNTPAVAAQPDGSYVMAWDDDFSGREGSLSYRYIPPGARPGNEGWDLLYSPAGYPAVDAVTVGRQGFDVLWHTKRFDKEPILFYRAHLDLRGMPEGQPVRLGGNGTEWVWQVKGSGFMAGWSLPSKHGIAARRLTSSGQRTGPELRLNSRLVDHPGGVSVVGLADASFVAVWLGVAPGNTGPLVLRARRFSPSGKPLGPDFDVNTTPLRGFITSFSCPPLRVAAAPGGGFAVAWLVYRTIYLRWFNAAGIPLGPEVAAITSADFDDGGCPQSMAFDDTGNLLLLGNLGYEALQVRLFDPQGTPVGPPLDVNDDDAIIPWGGNVAWTGDSWITTWVAGIFPYDQNSIYVRRFVKK
jgi:hypothetical protein